MQPCNNYLHCFALLSWQHWDNVSQGSDSRTDGNDGGDISEEEGHRRRGDRWRQRREKCQRISGREVQNATSVSEEELRVQSIRPSPWRGAAVKQICISVWFIGILISMSEDVKPADAAES